MAKGLGRVWVVNFRIVITPYMRTQTALPSLEWWSRDPGGVTEDSLHEFELGMNRGFTIWFCSSWVICWPFFLILLIFLVQFYSYYCYYFFLYYIFSTVHLWWNKTKFFVIEEILRKKIIHDQCFICVCVCVWPDRCSISKMSAFSHSLILMIHIYGVHFKN